MIKRKNYVVVLGCFMLLSGCVNMPKFQTPKWDTHTTKIEYFNVPPLGETRDANLGETILKVGQITTKGWIKLLEKAEFKEGIITPAIYPAAEENSEWQHFPLVDSNLINHSITTYKHDFLLGDMIDEFFSSFAVSKKDGKLSLFATITKNSTTYSPALNDPKYEIIDIPIVSEASFQQEFIYGGRADDILKFTYREFSGSTMRPSFNQEVQYDLKDGNIVGFKDARIEVIEASNTKLRYKVLQNFKGEHASLTDEQVINLFHQLFLLKWAINTMLSLSDNS